MSHKFICNILFAALTFISTNAFSDLVYKYQITDGTAASIVDGDRLILLDGTTYDISTGNKLANVLDCRSLVNPFALRIVDRKLYCISPSKILVDNLDTLLIESDPIEIKIKCLAHVGRKTVEIVNNMLLCNSYHTASFEAVDLATGKDTLPNPSIFQDRIVSAGIDTINKVVYLIREDNRYFIWDITKDTVSSTTYNYFPVYDSPLYVTPNEVIGFSDTQEGGFQIMNLTTLTVTHQPSKYDVSIGSALVGVDDLVYAVLKKGVLTLNLTSRVETFLDLTSILVNNLALGNATLYGDHLILSTYDDSSGAKGPIFVFAR